MIIELLNDVINNKSYTTGRNNPNDNCLLTADGNELFQKVGNFLISHKSYKCNIFAIFIDAQKNEISTIIYSQNDGSIKEEYVCNKVYEYLPPEQAEYYHQLCKQIIESAFICFH